MKKKKKTKWIILILIAAAAAAVGYYYYTSQLSKVPQGLPVEAASVVRMDLEQTVSVKGIVEGTDSAEVYSGSQRRITEILVKEGDRVHNGENLARLEEDTSTVNYEKALLELETAQRDYSNNKALYESGAVPRETFLLSETALKNAELTLKQLEETNDLFVTSPIDGTVTRIFASVGMLAGGSSAGSLFRIENIDQLQMKLKISEYDISKIKIGQEVRITSNVTGKSEITGRVSSIAPTGEEKNPGSSNMVIPVTVNIDRNQTELFAGVNAKASIITGEAENVLAVPIDAVLEDAETGEQYVLVIRDSLLHKAVVSPILENEFYLGIEETADLTEGAFIVLSPDYSMEDGMLVEATVQ